MGLAASQARYLEITARKTNVEYEGQQVNQQRTALANESAGLFSELMALQVPTPPSTSEFTEVQYTFDTGDRACTISKIQNLTGDPDYNTVVTYYYEETNYTGLSNTRSDLGVRNVAGAYWLTNGVDNRTLLTQCTAANPDYPTDVNALDQIVLDTGATTNLATDYAANIENIYKYTTTDGITYYYSLTDLNDAAALGGAATTLTNYYAADIESKVYNTSNAYMTKEDSGRYSEILLDGYSTSFDVNSTTSTDQNAYQDAMNEYEYQQARYQQEVNSINAKTEIIQEEDRTLELKLKQLDTEQEALQTEMESVKKVIDKNIEQTFKTFQ